MQFLRIVYSKAWTKQFALDMARRLPPPAYEVSKDLYIEAADNNFILMRIKLQRVGATHKNVDMIQRIRYFAHAPHVDALQLQAPSEFWVCPINWDGMRLRLEPAYCGLSAVLTKEWCERVTSGELQTVVSRPSMPIGKKTHMQSLRPYLGSASNSKHVDRYLCKVIRENRGKMAIGIGADQAFEKAVWGRVLQRPRMFRRVFTICDWFHVTVWVLAAVWDLMPKHMLYFVDVLKVRKRGKQVMFKPKMDEVDMFIHYEGLALAYIGGVQQFLFEYLPHTVIANERLFLEQYSQNKPLTELYKSWQLMLQWLELKRAVNEFDIVKLERMIPTLFHLCMASGHTNVANQMLRMEWQRVCMMPQVWQARMEASVVALTNKAAVGVGINFPVERLNLFMKIGSQGVQDVNAIFDIGETFNATMPVERHLNEWLGMSQDRLAWCGNVNNNAAAIKEHLAAQLLPVGGGSRVLRLPRFDSLFGYNDNDTNGKDMFDLHLGGYDPTSLIDRAVQEYSVLFI